MDRRWLWLIAAALLVIAAAWLVRIPEPREPLARPQVEMPRHLRPEERQRMLSRLRPPAVDAGVRRNEVRDPMLAALSAGGSGSGVVLEVNAVPGWRALAAVCSIDVAAEMVRFVEDGSSG